MERKVKKLSLNDSSDYLVKPNAESRLHGNFLKMLLIKRSLTEREAFALFEGIDAKVMLQFPDLAEPSQFITPTSDVIEWATKGHLKSDVILAIICLLEKV